MTWGFILLTSGRGLHNLTTGSIPLVANKHTEGWGCKQFTIESSPLNTLTIFVVLFSQIKNDPSSDPATIYWPLLKTKLPKCFLSFLKGRTWQNSVDLD